VATTLRKRRYCELLGPVLLDYGLEPTKVLEVCSAFLNSVDAVELEEARAEHAKRGKRQNQSLSSSFTASSQPNSSPPPSQSSASVRSSSNKSRLSKTGPTSLNASEEDAFTDFSQPRGATFSRAPGTPSPPTRKQAASSATTTHHTQQPCSDDINRIPDTNFCPNLVQQQALSTLSAAEFLASGSQQQQALTIPSAAEPLALDSQQQQIIWPLAETSFGDKIIDIPCCTYDEQYAINDSQLYYS